MSMLSVGADRDDSPLGARALINAQHSGAGRIVLSAIQHAVRELEGDASLGRRFRATQELARLLAEVSDDGDRGVCALLEDRGAASLLVALMAECGEEREATRNSVLACLTSVVRFLKPEELVPNTRLWQLLTRMTYNRDEASLLHTLTAFKHVSQHAECAETILASKRLPPQLRACAESANPTLAKVARETLDRLALADAGRDAAAASAAADAPPAANPERPAMGDRLGFGRALRRSREIMGGGATADAGEADAAADDERGDADGAGAAAALAARAAAIVRSSSGADGAAVRARVRVRVRVRVSP